MNARKEEVVMPFDTLAYAKKLESSGFSVQQAETQAEALAEVLETNFVSRDRFIHTLIEDVRSLRDEMNARFNQVFTKISELQNDMDTKLTGLRYEIDTKLTGLRHEMDERFSAFRHEVDAKFAQLELKLSHFKFDIIKWVFSISLGQTALVISALKFFH